MAVVGDTLPVIPKRQGMKRPNYKEEKCIDG